MIVPPEDAVLLLRELSGTAGAANAEHVGFDTFALLTGVFGTGLPSLRSVTVIGAWKFEPTTVIVAGRPGRPGRACRPGSGSSGEALVAVGWSVWNENGTEIGEVVHVRPGNVSSMAASVFPHDERAAERAPGATAP